jgi:hypothetical protein
MADLASGRGLHFQLVHFSWWTDICDLAPNEATDGVQVQKRISGLACDPTGPKELKSNSHSGAFVLHWNFGLAITISSHLAVRSRTMDACPSSGGQIEKRRV